MRLRTISFLAAAVLAAAVAGCKLASSQPNFYNGDKQEATAVPGFADEKYVWESFHTTTNRIEGSKR